MTQDEIKQVASDIVGEIKGADEFSGILDSNLVAYIIIGRAFNKNIHGLASTIDLWIRGNKPNREEQQQLEQKLSILGNNETSH